MVGVHLFIRDTVSYDTVVNSVLPVGFYSKIPGLPRAMADRDERQEIVKGMCAVGIPWWWYYNWRRPEDVLVEISCEQQKQ